MRNWLLATAALAVFGSPSAQAQNPAAAAIGPAPERKLSVTIYNSGQSLVEDARHLDLKAGRQRLEFKDVSPNIRSETVSLSAADVGIVEQNFDYDLLTPDILMEKAVGQQIRIVRTNPGTGRETTETATVLAANEGVVLQIGDRIEVLRDDGLPTRVIFDKVPPNLRARPTLSVTVDSARAGARETRLSYLTAGLGWRADYVSLFDEKSGRMDMTGWITLTNSSGTDYEKADVQLVAGQTGGSTSPRPRPPRGAPGIVTSAGTQSGEGALGDYYLYTLPERTTIAQNQTKQVSFLSVQQAPAKKVYRVELGDFASQEQPISADVRLDFTAGSGAASSPQMPAGVIRVYIRDAKGDPKFIGENNIPHTPAGSDLSVQTGRAFDVTLQPTLVSQERISDQRTRYEMTYLVRNARPEPVVVNVRQSGFGRRAKILKESLPSQSLNAFARAWEVAVPANGETTVTVSFENGW